MSKKTMLSVHGKYWLGEIMIYLKSVLLLNQASVATGRDEEPKEIHHRVNKPLESNSTLNQKWSDTAPNLINPECKYKFWRLKLKNNN